MKLTCFNCRLYHEEWDGDYGEIFCGASCEHPMASKRLHDGEFRGCFKYFPYLQAPGCFRPSVDGAPDKYKPKCKLDHEDKYFDWLGEFIENLNKWSGDHIELVS